MDGWKIFLNGNLESTLSRRFITYMSTINIGSNFVWSSDSSKNFNGYVDEFRISNCARYTQTFPAPIAPLFRDTSTLSLNHFNSNVVEDLNIYGKSTPSWNLNTRMIEKAAARFNRPSDIAIDSIGNMYVTDTVNNVIRKIDTSGNVSTPFNFMFNDLTNNGTYATSLCIDSSNNLYVNDYVSGTNTIYKINTTNSNVYKLYGGGAYSPTNNSGLNTASLHTPTDIAFDSMGNMYILDSGTNAIRKVIVNSSMIMTFATGISSAKGIAIDQNDNVFVSTTNYIYKVDTAGRAVIYAGTSIGGPTYVFGAPVEGHVSSVYFSSITGIAFDSSGNLFVCDTGYNMVRKIDTAGNVTNFVGNTGGSSSSLLSGYRTSVSITPTYCAFDSSGNLYVTEQSFHRVKKLLRMV